MRAGRPRRRLVAAAACLGVGAPLVGGLAAAVAISTPAVANTTGATPAVFVTSDSGPVDGFGLAGILAGNSPLTPGPTADLAGQLPDGQYGSPGLIAITRDSNEAVVVVNADTDAYVVPVNTSTGSTANPIEVVRRGEVVGIAADPAASDVVFALTDFGVIYEVDISTAVVTEISSVSQVAPGPFVPSFAASLAVSADGGTAYVGMAGTISGGSNAEGVFAVPLSSTFAPVSEQWYQQAGEGVAVTSLALTPREDELFGSDGSQMVGLSLPLSPTTPLTTVSMPGVSAVTIGPHGKQVFGAEEIPSSLAAFVNGVPVAGGQPVQLRLQTGAWDNAEGPVAITLTPDGSLLLATVLLGNPTAAAAQPFLFAIVLGKTGSGQLTMTIQSAVTMPAGFTPNGTSQPLSIAVTPDQAPVAAFGATVASAGSASSFDAGASSVRYGRINSFRWNFGDGSSAQSSNATITHVFASPGTYNVRLIEDDSAGTTIPPAFPGTPASWVSNGPGQTPYRLSSNSAETTLQIKVGSSGPPTTVTTPTSSTTTTTLPSRHHHPPPTKGKPVITLDPTVGPPGSVVTVTGRGFPANSLVKLEWSTPNGSSTAVSVKAVHGRFVTQLLVLVPDLLGQREAIAVGYTKANRPRFLVVAQAAEPGGSNALPVYRTEGP